MKKRIQKLAALALLPIAGWVFASCSSTPEPTGPVRIVNESSGGSPYEKGNSFGGGAWVGTTTTTNTVVAIDADQRTVTLRKPDGTLTNCIVNPDILHLDQVKVGDVVRVTVAEEMAVSIKPADAPLSGNAKEVVARVPSEVHAGVRAVKTRDFIASVVAVDAPHAEITLQFENGETRTVHAPRNVNLSDFSLGDKVAVQMTEATTIAVEKP